MKPSAPEILETDVYKRQVEESPQIDGLLILLNNGGGDVEAGLAISELIASMSKPVSYTHLDVYKRQPPA